MVLGGTLIFGGAATAVGTFLASILLILIVTIMQIAGLPPGAQDMVVILVLALAGREAISRHKVSSAKIDADGKTAGTGQVAT